MPVKLKNGQKADFDLGGTAYFNVGSPVGGQVGIVIKLHLFVKGRLQQLEQDFDFRMIAQL